MANSINLLHVLYIAQRLAPFMIVAYFALNSIFNWNARGAVYLLGLLICTGLTISISAFFEDTFKFENPNITCNIITLTGNISEPASFIPLNLVVYCFTMMYMIMSNILYLSELKIPYSSNMQANGFVAFFVLLIISELRKLGTCYNMYGVGAGIFIGLVCGVIWAEFIVSLASPDLAFYSTNTDVCSVITNSNYVCT